MKVPRLVAMASLLIAFPAASRAGGPALGAISVYTDPWMDLAERAADEMILRDPRIPGKDKPPRSLTLAHDLAASVRKEDVESKTRQLWSQNLTEQEMKFIVGVKRNPLAKKFDFILPRVDKSLREYILELLRQNFERVTKLKYQEDFSPPALPGATASPAPTPRPR